MEIKTTTVILSLTTAAFLLLVTGVDACDGMPSLSAVAACQQASTSAAMADACASVLGTSTQPQEVTNFLLTTITSNRDVFDAFFDAAATIEDKPSTPPDLNEATHYCIVFYQAAERIYYDMIYNLQDCNMENVRMDCATAVSKIDDCLTKLLYVRGGMDSVLYHLALLHRDRTMKRSVVLVFLLAAVVVVVDVHACDGVPSMSQEDACRKAFGTSSSTACTDGCSPSMYEFCITVLQRGGPAAGEATVFAEVAAKYAKETYESTAESFFRALQNASLAGGERAACAACRDTQYAQARSSTVGALNLLDACSFGQLRQQYDAAAAAVAACGDALSRLPSLSQLAGAAVADRRVAALASGVGELEATGFAVATGNATTASFAATRDAIGAELSMELAPDDIRLQCLVCADKYEQASEFISNTTDDKATITFLVLSLSVAITATGGDACDGAPWMTAAAACQKASPSPSMSRLCADTLGTSPDTQEATGFAVTAGNAATASFAASRDAIGVVLSNPLAPDDVRLPCLICAQKYDLASEFVASTADDVQRCKSLGDAPANLVTALAAIDDCATEVFKVSGNTTEVYKSAIADRDRSVLVLRLVMLLVSNQQLA
uniref:Pectinesterase inhibitor domain-containing protein n=1 Tax=Leersia perrieri TaxID=77586 RepID=A0A0D9X4A1_9ORYZ